MADHTSLSRFIYFAVAVLIGFGCAPLRPDTDKLLDRRAIAISNRARSFNQQIILSKGIGWARLETKNQVEKFKIAWAAQFPDKIRITFLLSGHPVETIVATEEKITLLSHTGKHPRQTYYSKDPDIKEYIHVPIKLSEMILILLGRLPVKNYDDAYFSPSDPSLSTIVLKQKWRSTTQYLQVDKKETVEGLKLMDNDGTLLYTMAITGYQTYDSNDIPVQIKFTDKDSQTLTLTILNFLPNPAIKESVFRLTEPG